MQFDSIRHISVKLFRNGESLVFMVSSCAFVEVANRMFLYCRSRVEAKTWKNFFANMKRVSSVMALEWKRLTIVWMMVLEVSLESSSSMKM